MRHVGLFSFIFVSLLSFSACRQADAPLTETDPEEDPSESDPNLPTEDSEIEIPNESFVSPPAWEMNRAPSLNPPEHVDYATDLLVIANCLPDPEFHLVSTYESMPVCANITVIPAQNSDGDFYEVAAPFTWSLDDPMGFDLDFPLGEHHNLTRPLVIGNPLDENGEERTTVLHACAMNSCPTPCPSDCVDTLCIDIPLIAVVQLEDLCHITSSQHDGTAIQISQNGREFKSTPGYEIKDGWIEHANVSFESGDYAFTGTIANNGLTMSGTVIDLMGLNPAGSWFAYCGD